MRRVATIVSAVVVAVGMLGLTACANDASPSVAPTKTSGVATPTTPRAPATSTLPATPTTTASMARGNDFYLPPDPLPAGRPGDVIRSRPFKGPSGTQAFEVLYLSTTVSGQPVAVSGVVIAPGANAPPAPPEGRTVLSWAHGTTGLGDACAPSKAYVDGDAAELLLAQVATSRGYVYAATDYQGLGPPGDHPYGVGLSAGRNVLDAARAAERLTGSAATPASKVLVWGHSQGGGAAAFAAELAPTYAPDVDVVGAIAGAPATELATIAQANDGGPYAGFSLMATVGFHAAYPDLDYAALLNQRGKQAVAAIDDECANAIAAKYAGTHFSDFTVVAPDQAPGWRDAYLANDAGQHATPVPIFLYQGDADEIIPVTVSKTLLDKYCALGVTASRKTYPGANHTSVITAALADILGFANDRLAGLPAPSSC